VICCLAYASPVLPGARTFTQASGIITLLPSSGLTTTIPLTSGYSVTDILDERVVSYKARASMDSPVA